MSSMTLRAIAYHEAGHAVIAAVLGVPFLFVTIIPTKKTVGRVVRKLILHTPEEREKDALVRLAGTIAEAKHTGWDNWRGALDDYRGMNLTETELEALKKKAKALVQQHWSAVCRVTSALLVHRRLSQEKVLALVCSYTHKSGREVKAA